LDTLLYYLARGLIGLLQSLPLRLVARLGRLGGGVVYSLDKRHREVALRNLTLCFGKQKSSADIRALAKENFRRIGESFACAVKTSAMTFEELRPYVEFVCPPVLQPPPDGKPQGRVVAAIGHFGNFELYARFHHFAPGWRTAATYRGLRQPGLDRLLRTIRERSGCAFFERRFESDALKAFMNQPGVLLGLSSDQHAGQNGVRLPFLGHDCSTTTSTALFAQRYRCTLIPGFCYRVGLAQWRIESGEEIPTHHNGKPRSPSAIMLDVNRAFEAAVLRDPANWFWVHNRWKLGRVKDPKFQTAELPVQSRQEENGPPA
jgi:KDO2-lipid IV(A) lauroyltransferase